VPRLPSARGKALGKQLFAEQSYAVSALPSVVHDINVAEWFWVFAECHEHSEKHLYPIVHGPSTTTVFLFDSFLFLPLLPSD